MKYFIKVVIFLFLVSPLCAKDDVETKLERLSNAHGVVGFEGPVREIIKEYWKPYLEEMHVDGMGNVVGFVKKREGRPRVLIMAHMDEVGFLVKEISDNGFVYVQPVGDWMDQVTFAQRWVIMTSKGPVVGYSGYESIHLLEDDMAVPIVSHKKMYLDVGKKSRDEVMALGIRPGLPISPDSAFVITSDPQRYFAKALDDRVMLVAITDILDKLKNADVKVDLVVAATVQEEIGLRGSEVVYNQVQPDLVINMDIGVARDFPQFYGEVRHNPLSLEKGPAFFIYDWTMIPNNKLVEFFIEASNKAQVPYQLASEENYGEDGGCLQKKGFGVPTINVGIPVRYAHGHYSMMDRRDYDHFVKLLVQILQDMTPDDVKNIRSF
jgi:putative aminopeptidase FrvX